MKTGKHQIGNARHKDNGTNGSTSASVADGSEPAHRSVDLDPVRRSGSNPGDHPYTPSGDPSPTVPASRNGHTRGDVGHRDESGTGGPSSVGDEFSAEHRSGSEGDAEQARDSANHTESLITRAPTQTDRATRARDLEQRAYAPLRRRFPNITDLQARVAIGALCIVFVAALAGVATVARTILGGPPGVVVTTARPSVITNEPGGVGTLAEAPNNSFTVSINLAGIQDAIFSISQVDVTDGALVAVGTPLVQIDPTLLVQNATQFQSQLVSAQQSLTDAEQASNSSQSDARAEAQQVAALSEEVAYDQELVSIAQGKSTTLSSPTSGYVTGLNLQPGQVVGAGQPILEVINPSVVDVSASLLLPDIRTIAPGDVADISPTGLPGVHLQGKVLTVSAISSAGGLDGTVVIQAQNTSPSPVPVGTQVFVHVAATQPAAISVPAVAVMNSDLQPAVFVLRNGRVHFQQVTLGAADPNRDQILAGLRAGDVVVESNMQSLTDGEKVRVLRNG